MSLQGQLVANEYFLWDGMFFFFPAHMFQLMLFGTTDGFVMSILWLLNIVMASGSCLDDFHCSRFPSIRDFPKLLWMIGGLSHYL